MSGPMSGPKSATVICGKAFTNVAELLHEAAREAPNAPAVRFNGATRSWAEVDARCRAAATLLSRLGVGPGDRVALLGLNSDVCFESYFSPALIGAMFVPLNYRLSARELKECLEDCAPKVLLAEAEFADTARAMREQCPDIRHLIIYGGESKPTEALDYESSLAEIIAEGAFAATQPGGEDDAILLFYTGGTTGKSKGVMLSNRNMLSNTACAVVDYGMEPGWNFIILGPLFHLAAGARIFNCAALRGCGVVMARFDAGNVLQAIARHRIDSVTFVPTMVQMVLDHPNFAEHDLSCLKIVTCGAAPLSLALQKRLLRALPEARHYQTYGMTEASPILTILEPVYHVTEGPLAEKLGSVGRPPRHVEVRVVDANDKELPPLAVGEVVARGPNIMLGYWRQPELTLDAMRGGWFHTGDAGYLDEGRLLVPGRAGQGHDRQRRRKRLSHRGRKCPQRAPRGERVRGHRHPPRDLGRGGARHRHPRARRGSRRRRAHRLLQAKPRRLQMPRERQLPRRTDAAVLGQQSAQNRIAQTLLGGPAKPVGLTGGFTLCEVSNTVPSRGDSATSRGMTFGRPVIPRAAKRRRGISHLQHETAEKRTSGGRGGILHPLQKR